MINYTNILDAVNRVNGHRAGIIVSPLENQLTLSLLVYKDRGEFDGTIMSAIECLTQAAYEIEVETFIIKDWAGNTCFKGKRFNTFEDAEEFLCLTLDDEYETDRQEYEITEVKS